MLKSAEIRRQAAQRLRELFPRAKAWEETQDVAIGGQTADLMVKFRLGEQEYLLIAEVCSLGQITERLHELVGHFRPMV